MDITLFGLGIVVGIIVVTRVVFQIFSVGTLRIDTSDPQDDPYIFLELDREIPVVRRKKYIILKVNTKNFLPQK